MTSVENAGRWSLLRSSHGLDMPAPGSSADQIRRRDEAIESFARALLRRYGVVFRRLLEREALKVSWFDLGRCYRRLEARGEIRGGHFVSGVSGEQFALPEAIGLLRSIRKQPAAGELLTISAADGLNLTGILTTGPRVTGITASRLLLRDGLPVAALEADQVIDLEGQGSDVDPSTERLLRIGTLPAALRPYYS
ncbi:MAG: hypothetical protein U1G07_04460 [Verrucomicrobiota bacterium]